jgi:glycosyltransferase involved in cell wall biosynthesis
MRLLERAGHQVVAYERSNSELQDGSLLGRVAIAPRMVWSWEARSDFASILDELRPDIVHVHNTFLVISPSIYSACSQRRIPVIQTLHNFRLLCPAGTFLRDGIVCHECVHHTLLRSIRYGCYRDSRTATAGVAVMLTFHRVLDTWCRSVTRFIALTQSAKEKFIEAGFPLDKFVVKPNFADPDPSERSGPGVYAVYIGRLTEDKGLRVLLNAWNLLPRQYPLHIVGDGPDRAAFEARAREMKLSGVTFRGWLSRAQAIETVKGARFSIVPSVRYEGFPMVVVEAFACGTPVLCSRLGGLAEIVEDHVTGLHFKPGDAEELATTIGWAWDHPSELVRMGHAARAEYETKYTMRKNYEYLMDIYEQALATMGRQHCLTRLGQAAAVSSPGITTSVPISDSQLDV